MDKSVKDWIHSLNVNTKDREKITLFALYSLYNSYDDIDFKYLQNILLYDNSDNISDNIEFVINKKNKILNTDYSYRDESPERNETTNNYNFKLEDIYFIFYILIIIIFYLKLYSI
uniref:Uncharacterized protein n=1 Tax=viral metagenome TaxID=1070528 RepID=A0A6C0CZ60_9ZZZZ